MSLTLLIVQTLNGLQLGVLLFLIAAGLTLVFGVMDFINLAHGVQYMLGAYLEVRLARAVHDVEGRLERFATWKKQLVTRDDILGGELVFPNSRLAVRHIGEMARRGAKLIAFSTIHGCVQRDGGFDVDELLRLRAAHGDRLVEHLGAGVRPATELFGVAADVFVPGARIEAAILWALPMTKVTAIVSPRARPRPSMMPPMTPTRVNGRTTLLTTSQVVQPMP